MFNNVKHMVRVAFKRTPIPEEAENKKETWAEAEEKVMKTLEEKMELPARDIKVEITHRVGSRKSSKPRAIVVKLLNYKDRERVLKSRRNLAGSTIFVRKDFSDGIARYGSKKEWKDCL